MRFEVSFKGIRYYSGTLSEAFSYIQGKWGSTESAWELGVKLTPKTFGFSR